MCSGRLRIRCLVVSLALRSLQFLRSPSSEPGTHDGPQDQEPIVARHVPAHVFATLMLLGYLNWLLDCATLLAALAVHATVPWVGVLLAYSLGQLVANTRQWRYNADASRGKTRGPTRRYSSMRPPFLSSRRELFSASETGVDVIDLARNELLTSAPRPASHGHSPGSA
jgi:hypothetical protein